MKKLCIVSATRAEYGILKNLIKKFIQEKDLDVRVVATGTHLAPEFGYTCREILDDGIQIDKAIPILLSGDSPCAVCNTSGLAIIEFGQYFEDSKPDMILVLGDRYEMLSVCVAAMIHNIPIAHLHGGERTEGAMDERIRHAITKISYLHFPCTEEYRNRIIQLGEEPSRVYNVGALSVENITNAEFIGKKDLGKELSFELGDKYAVVTFHPETLQPDMVKNQMEQLIKALSYFKDMKYLITGANADAGGSRINEIWREYERNNPTQVKVVPSLGMRRYLSAVKYAKGVIGNSSSGIIEAPVLGVATVNIGMRQAGRIRTNSIVDCDINAESIEKAILQIFSEQFQKEIEKQENPYGTGDTSEKIVKIIKEYLTKENSIEKKFYDIKWNN